VWRSWVLPSVVAPVVDGDFVKVVVDGKTARRQEVS
jgi:hypothetical protein